MWAAIVHSFQLSNMVGKVIGGIHLFPTENEHTHIIKVNFIIDKLLKKSYIIVQMKGTHDWYNKIPKRFSNASNIQDINQFVEGFIAGREIIYKQDYRADSERESKKVEW